MRKEGGTKERTKEALEGRDERRNLRRQRGSGRT